MHEWTYTLKFKSPASVFSGLAVAGLLDRMIVRNREGLPFIPGSSVKGRWRYFAERLLYTHGAASQFHAHSLDGPICKDADNCCTLCNLFGNASIPSAIWVGQAEPEIDDELKEVLKQLSKTNKNPVCRPDCQVHPGIALDRSKRVALPDHLFFDETAPYVSFAGKIIFKRQLSSEEKKFLKVSARLVDRIGGRKAVGRGALEGGIGIKEVPS